MADLGHHHLLICIKNNFDISVSPGDNYDQRILSSNSVNEAQEFFET